MTQRWGENNSPENSFNNILYPKCFIISILRQFSSCNTNRCSKISTYAAFKFCFFSSHSINWCISQSIRRVLNELSTLAEIIHLWTHIILIYKIWYNKIIYMYIDSVSNKRTSRNCLCVKGLDFHRLCTYYTQKMRVWKGGKPKKGFNKKLKHVTVIIERQINCLLNRRIAYCGLKVKMIFKL